MLKIPFENVRNVAQSCSTYTNEELNYQCKELEVKTLQDALVAYRTYTKAEVKNPKTIDWVVSSVGCFAEFLDPKQ